MPGTHPSEVSIVIPAWHEADRIGPTLRRLVPILSGARIRYEILVVCDGGNDGTAFAVEEFGDPQVRSIAMDHRLGKGGAVIEGLRNCHHSIIGFVDADCSLPEDEVLALIRQVESSECVIGSRFGGFGDPRSRIDSRPLTRIVLSQCWRIFVSVLFQLQVSDTQCGAKFFQRESILPVLRKIEVTDWTFDVSLLYHVVRAGIKITEVPVTPTHNDGSKLNVPRVVPAMFVSAVALRLVNSPFRAGIPPRMIQQIRKLMSPL